MAIGQKKGELADCAAPEYRVKSADEPQQRLATN